MIGSKDMGKKIIKLFLRLSISLGFLSAVADRLGMWRPEVSVWGNWDAFLSYTEHLNAWLPSSIIPFIGSAATIAEVIFAFFLLLGFKTELFAKLSAILLLIFALSMTFSTGIKSAFDFSVYSASAAAFALGVMKVKFLELDCLFKNTRSKYKFTGFKYR
ncbi:MAG TPA: hypothetical protein VK084_00555 [Chitinophagaceae bacterium]|nr:hypothetical protein [Chitinophagaceae bacterium]